LNGRIGRRWMNCGSCGRPRRASSPGGRPRGSAVHPAAGFQPKIREALYPIGVSTDSACLAQLSLPRPRSRRDFPSTSGNRGNHGNLWFAENKLENSKSGPVPTVPSFSRGPAPARKTRGTCRRLIARQQDMARQQDRRRGARSSTCRLLHLLRRCPEGMPFVHRHGVAARLAPEAPVPAVLPVPLPPAGGNAHTPEKTGNRGNRSRNAVF
jgi:hypothetical protein